MKRKKLSLPQLLITHKMTHNLNSKEISNSIISRFKEIGIPNNLSENGKKNYMNKLIKATVEELVKTI